MDQQNNPLGYQTLGTSMGKDLNLASPNSAIQPSMPASSSKTMPNPPSTGYESQLNQVNALFTQKEQELKQVSI